MTERKERLHEIARDYVNKGLGAGDHDSYP